MSPYQNKNKSSDIRTNMSPYQNKNKSSRAVSLETIKTMSVRRNLNENASYEDISDGRYCHGSNNKRPIRPSNGARTKRQKIMRSSNRATVTTSTATTTHAESSANKMGYYPSNLNNLNNNYDSSTLTSPNAYTRSVSSIPYDNNNNVNKFNDKGKGIALFNNRTNRKPATKIDEIPLPGELVEVKDSDSEEDLPHTSKAKNGKYANGDTTLINNLPSYIVDGRSNSGYSTQHYAKLEPSNSYSRNDIDWGNVQRCSQQTNTTDSEDMSSSNTSGDFESLQREIEEVTRVNKKFTITDEEKVNLSHFTLICVLGAGAFGKVFLVRKNGGYDDEKLYAMKVLDKDRVIHKKKTAEHTATERQVLEIIQESPFLVRLNYAFQTGSKLYLVLDYVNGGELFTHLDKVGHFPEATVKIYIAEVVLALEHLHKLGIIYRDIKLENILLDRQGHIVLADFGLSKIFSSESDHRAYSYCGTLDYMAPELVSVSRGGHDLAVDWWAVGVLTYELLTGTSPFNMAEKQNCEIDMIYRRIQKVDPVFPSTMGKTAKDFILKMLHKDPKKRLGGNKKCASDIKNHPFFRGINWNELKSKQGEAPFKPTLNGDDDTQNFNDEFTKQPVIDYPAAAPVNTHRLFRGYSYVAPQHLHKRLHIKNTGTFPVEYLNAPITDPHSAPETLILKKLISTGSFGKCYTAVYNNQIYAVKVIPEVKYRPSEVDALISCGQDGHKSIAQYVATYRKGSDIWIVQEYVSGYELAERIANHEYDGFDELKCCDIFKQLIDAVRHIHGKRYIHGDLKMENIIFAGDDMNQIKLVDFGAACYSNKRNIWNDVPRYTVDYAPPEALQHPEYATYSASFDIWCLGATLYSIFMGHTPFRHGHSDQHVNIGTLKQRILDDEIFTYTHRWDQASLELRNLILRCLQKDIAKRPTLEEIFQHPWLLIRTKQATSNLSKDISPPNCSVYMADTNRNRRYTAEVQKPEKGLRKANERSTPPRNILAARNNTYDEKVAAASKSVDRRDITAGNVGKRKQRQSYPQMTKSLFAAPKAFTENVVSSSKTRTINDASGRVLRSKYKSGDQAIVNTIPLTVNRNGSAKTSQFSSDLEDFCGFDESLVSFISPILNSSKEVRSKIYKPVASGNAAESSSEFSAQMKDNDNAAKIVHKESSTGTRNDLEATSLAIDNAIFKIPRMIEGRNLSLRPSVSYIAEKCIADNYSEDCFGYEESKNVRRRKRIKAKCRKFNFLLYYTQNALRHFKNQRRVYKKPINVALAQTSLNRLNTRNSERNAPLLTKIQQEIRTPPSRRRSTLLPTRIQPSRLAKQHSSYYRPV
uniref:non-specific serine/threonine protein kinase n=1 Tax=Glossina brevipalpis TaxID=37001 RepID=A0A1A9X1H9_9MUSC